MISFIVPVKNGLEYTRALVRTVRERNPGSEVEWVIVDSGSTDGTLEFCRDIGARVVPFRSSPFNYCAAVNAGAAAAHGDLWLIANNDIEFRSEGDLTRVERVFREWPLVAVLSPGRPEGAAELEFLEGGINGATWVVRPAAFRAWGGMPETMTGYGFDEAYTAVQCMRHGFGNAWLTGWDVFHHGSVTFGPESGNVTPALRRNLSRLLAALSAEDLDVPRDAPYRILERLRERERARAPFMLNLANGTPAVLARQGYANVCAVDQAAAVAAGTAVAIVSQPLASHQWLPWLANELLLQPGAGSVGSPGCWALRASVMLPWPVGEDRIAALCAQARAVGPPAPVLMPPLSELRPTPKQRLVAWLHDLRRRRVRLPEGW